jgi:hypothetical protein
MKRGEDIEWREGGSLRRGCCFLSTWEWGGGFGGGGGGRRLTTLTKYQGGGKGFNTVEGGACRGGRERERRLLERTSVGDIGLLS